MKRGYYLMEVTGIETTENGLVWSLRRVTDLHHHTPLAGNELWKLKRLTQALGVYQDGSFEIDQKKIVGKKLLVKIGRKNKIKEVRPPVNEAG